MTSAVPAAAPDAVRGSRRVVATAPGKLFVAGEYAVVESGYPAVLVGVERRVTLVLDEAPTQRPVEQGRYVGAVRAVVEALAAARGRTAAPYAMTTSSALKDAATADHPARKYGLGSSGAVTVAAVRALDAWYGLGLTAAERLRAAILATLRVNPRASGGDVAASLLGGWVAYSSPDRGWVAARDAGPDAGPGEARAPDRVAALVADDWPGLAATALPVPAAFGLRIGWTGDPASTTDLVAAVRAAGVPAEFLAGSRAVVADLRGAIDADDADRARDAVRRARGLLRGLGELVGVAIETPELAALIEVAERHGYAAKGSGAGGGDCGIAVGGPAEDPDLATGWAAVGVVPLALRIAAPATVSEETS
ncbi:phosphomevalonate kinase [Salana multivorans]|uniref:phosphomevalonate kinase n=1 Tax=Salana multivorans TaxID=120377 RepID=A0A3N2DBG8_9MICO|nr:phosphomevalonate kinase [Salana multivorans]ROR97145.1 phosphomevalonate kinase [Salana multivorans]